jgi:hypothetical protein
MHSARSVDALSPHHKRADLRFPSRPSHRPVILSEAKDLCTLPAASMLYLPITNAPICDSQAVPPTALSS